MGHGKSQKKFVVKPATPMNSDINVTPLVDVVLVLLIIFMVVTPLLEKDIGVRVPQTEEVQEVVEIPPDQLVVRVNASGELTLNWHKIDRADLVEKLSVVLDSRHKAEDKVVFVIADDEASYATVVSVLDASKEAGAEVLGMMTEKADNEAPAP